MPEQKKSIEAGDLQRDDKRFEQACHRVAQWSPLCADWMQACPEQLQHLRQSGALDDELTPLPAPAEFAAGCKDSKQLMTSLRQLRNERLFVIAWRDLLGVDGLVAVLAALTRLAEFFIQAAIDHAAGQLECDANSIVVLGMGKLGGNELNFSSDIDLIFAHENLDDDESQANLARLGKKLAQRVVQTLNEQTADGFVYRVDTRLRPFGDSGPLVASLDAMESYYQSHGREWERYALIKARPVAGNIDAGNALLQRLKPFVYRRYLDFGAFESMREMKALIEKQVRQRDMEDNIKLGRGGIREIEFIAQAFQLIRGGHEPALQDHRLLPTLAKLGEADHLPAKAVAQLRDAYAFLRRLENRLQIWADRQTHDLPETAEQQAALAASMGMDDWPALRDRVAYVRERVHEHFDQVFVAPQVNDGGDESTRKLRSAWDREDTAGAKLLREAGFAEPEEGWARLLDLRSGGLYDSLGDRGRRRIAELLPLLIQAVAARDNPDRALDRMLGVIDRIIGRTTYVDLLLENPAVLSRLVTLCAASPWIAGQIESQPVLLDALIDPRVLFHPPRKQQMQKLLARELEAVAQDDLENRMDTLRRFSQEQMLRVAAADVTNSMPLMTVSDHLTELAEVIIQASLQEAWRELTARHGNPLCSNGEMAPFVVIGYGKLGGMELGYGSDLDLVFLHGGREDDNTDGKRSLSHAGFFLRLAQRLIHLLSTQTGAGRAYEIDTRLRPSGRSGLLVVSMEAFERYQQQKAWTWEHQALVRARPVAGDPQLASAFQALRERIIGQEQNLAELRSRIIDMREKMRRELDRSNADSFDLKQGRGGLVDIEFLAQFAVLRLGGECEELLLFTDTIRTIETLESGGYMNYEDARRLTKSYRAYRRAIHSAALQDVARAAPPDTFAEQTSAVSEIWTRLVEGDWPDNLEKAG